MPPETSTWVLLLTGLCAGGLATLSLYAWIDPDLEPATETLMIPQPILDALNAALTSKGAADAATASKASTASALVSAQAADAAAAQALTAATGDLTAKLAALKAVEDSYFVTGS